MTAQHYRQLEVWRLVRDLAEKCHLSMARGSLMELETHLLLSQRVASLEQSRTEQQLALCDRINRMLSGLRSALEKRL